MTEGVRELGGEAPAEPDFRHRCAARRESALPKTANFRVSISRNALNGASAQRAAEPCRAVDFAIVPMDNHGYASDLSLAGDC